MKNKIAVMTSAVLLFATMQAFAAEEAKVKIVFPENGATVAQNMKLEFEAQAGPEGNHLHLYVDGKRVDVIHQLMGSTMVSLTPGKHHVCLEVNTKGHVAVSPQTCIDVTAK